MDDETAVMELEERCARFFQYSAAHAWEALGRMCTEDAVFAQNGHETDLEGVMATLHGMTNSGIEYSYENARRTAAPAHNRIVEQHHGWVSAESRQGEGSRFTVSFPACSAAAPDPAPSHRALAPGGDETIFLVEDESMVRPFARRLLDRHGYRVIEAHNGLHALDLWEKHAGEIDLLLTDVVMPGGINGTDLARQLTTKRPDLKVVFTSGYAADLFRGDIELPGEAAFIAKPYPSEDLLRKLRQILDEPCGSALALPS